MLAKGWYITAPDKLPPSSSIRCRDKHPHHASLARSAIRIATKTLDPCVRVLSSVAVMSIAKRLGRPPRPAVYRRIMKQLRNIFSYSKQHLFDVLTVVVMFAVLVVCFLWL
jgi:hypothetical protein